MGASFRGYGSEDGAGRRLAWRLREVFECRMRMHLRLRAGKTVSLPWAIGQRADMLFSPAAKRALGRRKGERWLAIMSVRWTPRGRCFARAVCSNPHVFRGDFARIGLIAKVFLARGGSWSILPSNFIDRNALKRTVGTNPSQESRRLLRAGGGRSERPLRAVRHERSGPQRTTFACSRGK